MFLRDKKEYAAVDKCLNTEFEHNLLADAVGCFDESTRSLRVNHLATDLRELGRIWLAGMAPKECVHRCSWFVQDRELKEKDRITRAQSVKYAIQAGLSDDFISGKLNLNDAVSNAITQYANKIKELSKYTHVSMSSYCNQDGVSQESIAVETLTIFGKIGELVQNVRLELIRNIEGVAAEVLSGLRSGVQEELDSLATHYAIDNVEIEDVCVVDMNAESITYRVNGDVNVQLQYGSDSDVARDDGLVLDNSYPFTGLMRADIDDPLDLEIIRDSLRVDNSSFYE